jgi:hypothetical protein
MLAQSFKSAAELRISNEHIEALQKVLVMLETGKMIHIDTYMYMNLAGKEKPRGFSGLFNMDSWTADRPCGTVACIGGTAELISGLDFMRVTDSNRALYDLFYPQCISSYNKITIGQAAQALWNYLTHGTAWWHKVLDI